MSMIKIDELNDRGTVSPEDAANVKGGPAYMKLGDIKGDSTASASEPIPTEQISLNYEKARFSR